MPREDGKWGTVLRRAARGLLCCALLLCLWAASAGRGRAEEGFISYAHTDDFTRYAATVAALNQQADEDDVSAAQTRGPLRQAAARLWGVLCATDGRELSAEPDGLACRVAGPGGRYMLYYASREQAERAVEACLAQEGTLYAELDAEVTAASMDDPGGENPSGDDPGGEGDPQEGETAYAFHSWGAQEMDFAAYLDHAGRWGAGQSVVAVIDSGVCRHPLLDARMPVSGYDYVDADDDATSDLYGHGTHVAGIIADCTHGMPVRILPIRVLKADGKGKMSNVVNAVVEATEWGVDVINLSVESTTVSVALDTAIRAALERNIVVVVAAGNSNRDTESIYPAHMTDQGVIVVGAATLSDGLCARYASSNYGESVDMYAFGANISSCSMDGGFILKSGTSMAAPHISALSALLRLLHPGLSPAAIEGRAVAAAGVRGGVFIPDLRSMVPTEEGLRVLSLTLRAGETIGLPTAALPLTARESVSYQCDGDAVLSLDGGALTALEPGAALVTVSCTGFDDMVLEITVEDAGEGGDFTLPQGLTLLEDGACAGIAALERVALPDGLAALGAGAFDDCAGLRLIRVPASVEDIGENTFSDAVVLCPPGSAAHQYCLENGLQYILEQ